MSMFYFPKESYTKRNYKIIYYDLSKANDVFFIVGDWVDVYSYPSNVDLSLIYIRLNDSQPISLSMLPVTSPFMKIELLNNSGITTGYVSLIVGEEFFKRDKQSVEITNDRTKTSDVKSLSVSVTTTAQAIDSNDASYRSAVTILAPETNTANVLIGNVSTQAFPLSPGASITILSTSLSRIYVKSASGNQTLYVITGGS